MNLSDLADSTVQRWRKFANTSEPLSDAVVRRLRGLITRVALNATESLLPDSLLARGTYEPDFVPLQDWEKEYAGGRWSYMNGLDELGRYSIIVGYYDFFKQSGTILDVGCGEGILQQKLAAAGYNRYLGVDICANAIGKAAARADSRTEFRHADIASFAPDRKFDTIIFNEVLYYLSDPAAIVRRLADSLEPNGVILVSIWSNRFDRRKSLRLWRLIDSVAQVVDSTTAANREAWTIKVFRTK